MTQVVYRNAVRDAWGCRDVSKDAARDSQRLSGLQLCSGLEECLRLPVVFVIGRGLRTGRDAPG